MKVGDKVIKGGGDYVFKGTIQSVFTKRSGVTRYVVENDDGILHIFNGAVLATVADYAKTSKV